MLSRLPRTQRQKEVFDYLVSFLERRGYIPTYTQIAKHLGVKSRATVAKHIKALERLGLISIQDEPFVITIIRQEVPLRDSFHEIRVEGRIAAGQPIEAVRDEDMIAVPIFMLSKVRAGKVYALKVEGDSMIDEHICDGDIALIENRTEARDGEIVVALVEGARATLKRLYRFGTEVELRPANAQHAPIRLHASKVAVQGIFRGLLRPAL
jgi:repressor LexA